jgi:hypothetical protein
MAGRVILAALIGGAAMFGVAFVEHSMLHLVDRQMLRPEQPGTAAESISRHFPSEGVYFYPPMPADPSNVTQQDRTALNDAYKKGPAGLIVIAPTGQDLMGPMQFGGEFATNVFAALLAAAIVAMLRPDAGFAGRWAAVFLMGLMTWVAVNASYYLWYRFPLLWVRDELICTMAEWAAAGIAIALIVRPKADEMR